MNENKKFTIDLSKAEIEIQNVKAGSQVIARAVVIFNDRLEIRGFKIIKSKFDKQEYVVKPPSFKRGNKWINMLRVHDEDIWSCISAKVIEKFEEKNISEHFKDNPIEEEPIE